MKHRFLVSGIFFLFFSYISATDIASYNFHAPISKHSESDSFILGASSLIQHPNGAVYFGNQDGLTFYDGLIYNNLTINEGAPINSLLFKENILFAGLTDDFGYFEPDETGNLHFVSLKPDLELPFKGMVFNNIGISDNSVYFGSCNLIFVYNPDTREIQELSYNIAEATGSNSKIHNFTCFNINDGIYAQLSDGNFYKYSKDNWTLYWSANKIGDEIVAIVTPGNFRRSTARIPDDSFVFTKNGKIFKIENGNPLKLDFENKELFDNYQITSACNDNNNIYIGFDGGGVLKFRRDGSIIRHLTSDDGLVDNFVTGLMHDRDNNIWVTHNRGFSILHEGLPFEVAHSDAHALTTIEPSNDESLSTFTESFNLNSSLRPMQWVSDKSSNIWGANIGGGISKYKISSDSSEFYVEKFYQNLDGSSMSKNCHVFDISGKILFSQDSKLYTYDDDTDSFRQLENLNIDLPLDKEIKDAVNVTSSNFWIETPEAFCYLVADSAFTLEGVIPLELLPGSKKDGVLKIIKEGRYNFVPLRDGLVRIDMNKLRKPSFLSKLSFNSIGAFTKKGDLLRYPISGNKKVKTDLKNLSVVLSFPEYNFMPLEFRFLLKGGGNTIDTITNKPAMQFSELGHGNYSLLCQAIAPDGIVLDEIAFNFTEIAPWPLRWWAWIIYIAILALIVYILSGLRVRQLLHTREQQFSASKSKQDKMIREQALIIANQGKKIHEKRLSAKSREMMEISPSSFGRQVVLDNLHSTIDLRLNKEMDVSIAERVLKELSGAGGDNRIFWDLFHKNFDLINEEYFIRMTEKFPSLTATDLKFCILLKMEMATKEISKFTGLSVRGVETARYRLRKKLISSPDQSLPEFLKEI